MADPKDIEYVYNRSDDGSRPGYYKDSFGRWRRDRRANPERRHLNGVSAHHIAMRKNLRRKVDRQALQYVRRSR